MLEVPVETLNPIGTSLDGHVVTGLPWCFCSQSQILVVSLLRFYRDRHLQAEALEQGYVANTHTQGGGRDEMLLV